MNRLRARRKAKEQQRGESYSDLNHPIGLSFGSKTFGRNKKPVPESKPIIDLATVLPSSNDFRTSLIMPNLSARFSMLREQDDPSTKIGKANDDSVLYPKRASRLNISSHHLLPDIVEVGSIPDSIRPPFAYGEGKHSFDADGYDSDNGANHMGRSRPGEGNTLFGGRQKLYKIPVDPSPNSSLRPDASQPDSGSMNGRVMYENDVSLSLFQQHREQEREGQSKQQERDNLDDAENHSHHSPATSFSRDRGTTSSTTSVPRRTSTAATSVESQSPSLTHNNDSASSLSSSNTAAQPKPGLDHSVTVYSKVNGQALSQSTSLHRMTKDVPDNVSRPRATAYDKKDKKTEAAAPFQCSSNLIDVSPRTIPSGSPFNFRLAGPPPSASLLGMARVDATRRDAKLLEGSPSQVHPHARPLSPPVRDGEDTAIFVNSVQPKDRGKATAMGLFKKPSQAYDEQQFSKRQHQMYEGRSCPAPPKRSPYPASTPTSTPAAPEALVSVLEPQEVSEEKSTVTNEARVRVTPLIRRQNEELAALEPRGTGISRLSQTTPPAGQNVATGDNFLHDDARNTLQQSEAAPSFASNQTSHETHPAFRPVVEGFKFPTFHTLSDEVKSIDEPSDPHRRSMVDGNGSDPHSKGLGLGGLIRIHLRNDSDKSSIHPTVSPQLSPRLKVESPKIGASPLNKHDFEESAQGQEQVVDIHSKMAQSAKQFLDVATLLKSCSNNQTQPSLGQEAGKSTQKSEDDRSWQDELQARHQRGGSTETQQEREAFNHELAERRRKVQEKLKVVAGSNTRSVSPVLFADSNPAKPGAGFPARLRAKSSRKELNNSRSDSPVALDSSAKAVKHLEPGPGSAPDRDLPKGSQQELWREEEERMLEDFGRRRKPKPSRGPSPRTKDFPPAPPAPPSSKTSPVEDGERSRQRSATPASASSSVRDRSISGAAGRSKSRNGQYRDDEEKVLAQETGSHTNFPYTPRPSTETGDRDERSTSALSGRYQGISRANTAGHFESKTLKPLQTSGMPSPLSSRPSPRTPYSANSTPPITEASLLVSNSSTSTLTQAADGRTTPSFRDRKRSISKEMISDPTFISTTYNVATVDLPPGASLRNGDPDVHQRNSYAPAIPFINPSRRRDRGGTGSSTTSTLLSSLSSRLNDSKTELASPQSAALPPAGDRSIFSGDADERRPTPPRSRPRLRNVSSEGGDMHTRARHQALMAGPSPALPTFPIKRGPSPTMQRLDGGMF